MTHTRYAFFKHNLHADIVGSPLDDPFRLFPAPHVNLRNVPAAGCEAADRDRHRVVVVASARRHDINLIGTG